MRSFLNRQRGFTNLACLAAPFLLASIPWMVQAMGQEADPASATKETTSSEYHRLPAYYGKVITPEQREQIYQIQDEYGPEIARLRKALKKVVDERDRRVQALLSAEQKQQLEEIRAERRRLARERRLRRFSEQENLAPPTDEGTDNTAATREE